MLHRIYGNAGVYALAYYVVSLLKHDLMEQEHAFPYMSFVGPKGAGKTTLIYFLNNVFFQAWEGIVAAKNSTPKALARKLCHRSSLVAPYLESNNALVNIDENSLLNASKPESIVSRIIIRPAELKHNRILILILFIPMPRYSLNPPSVVNPPSVLYQNSSDRSNWLNPAITTNRPELTTSSPHSNKDAVLPSRPQLFHLVTFEFLPKQLLTEYHTHDSGSLPLDSLNSRLTVTPYCQSIADIRRKFRHKLSQWFSGCQLFPQQSLHS